MRAAIALLKLLLGFFITAQARQREAAIVVRARVGRVGFLSVGKKLLGCGVVLAAKSEFAEARECTGVVGIASENALEKRFGFVIMMSVESDLAKLKVGLGLLGLEADRDFELALCVL